MSATIEVSAEVEEDPLERERDEMVPTMAESLYDAIRVKEEDVAEGEHCLETGWTLWFDRKRVVSKKSEKKQEPADSENYMSGLSKLGKMEEEHILLGGSSMRWRTCRVYVVCCGGSRGKMGAAIQALSRFVLQRLSQEASTLSRDSSGTTATWRGQRICPRITTSSASGKVGVEGNSAMEQVGGVDR